MLKDKDQIEFECYLCVDKEKMSSEEVEETIQPIAKCLQRNSFLTLSKDLPYRGENEFYKVKVNITVME